MNAIQRWLSERQFIKNLQELSVIRHDAMTYAMLARRHSLQKRHATTLWSRHEHLVEAYNAKKPWFVRRMVNQKPN